MRRPWLLNLVLLALIAAAGVRLAAYLRSPLPELPGAPGASETAAPADALTGAGEEVPAGAAEAPAEDYEEIAAHDLFSQARGVAPPRAPAPAAAAAAPKVQPPPKLTLYGVVIVDGERSAFLVEGGGDAKPRKLREGESIGGGTLKTIRADGVTLSFPSGEVNVALRTPKEGGAAPLPGLVPPTTSAPARVQPGQRRLPGAQQRTGTVPAVPVPGAVGRRGRALQAPQDYEEDYEEDYDEEFLDEEEDYYDEDYLDEEEDYYDEDY